MSITISDYGLGSFQTLRMRTRDVSQFGSLNGYRGVTIFLESAHRDGASPDCRMEIDLPTRELAALIKLLSEDLEKKIIKDVERKAFENEEFSIEYILNSNVLMKKMTFIFGYGSETLDTRLAALNVETFAELLDALYGFGIAQPTLELTEREGLRLGKNLSNEFKHIRSGTISMIISECCTNLFNVESSVADFLRQRFSSERSLRHYLP
jgi:hypothetical protein